MSQEAVEQKIEFDFFYGAQADQFAFIRLPKELIMEEYFRKLSSDAKILYGILLDRMSLSVKNHWVDEQNRVYIIFTIEEVMETFACGERKAVNLMGELDDKKGIGLIHKRRQGLGRPNLIYVKNFLLPKDYSHLAEEADKPEETEPNFRQPEIRGYFDYVRLAPIGPDGGRPFDEKTDNSGCFKARYGTNGGEPAGPADDNRVNARFRNSADVRGIYTNNNNTDLNNQSIHPSVLPFPRIRPKEPDGRMERYLAYEDFVKDRVEYDLLIREYTPEEVDPLMELIVETICSERETIRISGEDYPRELVKGRFLKLGLFHMRYILQSLQTNCTKVTNIKNYLLTVLFNASITMDPYYQAKVNYDQCGGQATGEGKGAAERVSDNERKTGEIS